MTTAPLNQTKLEKFGAKMIAVMNHAALALMTSIGHQTGLFATLANLPPATSLQVARAAGLHERYVREWLGAMVTGRVIDYDPKAATYLLPPEHAAWLTPAAGSKNLARETQFVALLGNVEQGIVESFRKGGGVPYADFPRFQQVMAEGSSANAFTTLLDTTLPLVPSMVQRLQRGSAVADIGCGQGYAILQMAQAFPQSQFIGYDFSAEAIATGSAEAHRLGLANAHFAVKDVAALDIDGQFDFITAFDAIHDQARPATVLQGIANALRPDGTFLMVDIAASSRLEENLDLVFGPWMYTISCMHCMTVSLALDGEGLGAAWGEQKALQMLGEAGFTQVAVKRLESDLFNNYYIATKQSTDKRTGH